MQKSKCACEFISKMIQRKNGVNKKNWNLFAGDIEYKTNFFLQFLVPFVFERFTKDKFQRFRFAIRALICIYAITWIILGFFSKTISILHFVFMFLTLSCSYYFLTIQKSNILTCMMLFIADHFIQTALYHVYKPISLLTFFALFNIPTFIASKILLLFFFRSPLGLCLVFTFWNFRLSRNYKILYQFRHFIIPNSVRIWNYLHLYFGFCIY